MRVISDARRAAYTAWITAISRRRAWPKRATEVADRRIPCSPQRMPFDAAVPYLVELFVSGAPAAICRRRRERPQDRAQGAPQRDAPHRDPGDAATSGWNSFARRRCPGHEDACVGDPATGVDGGLFPGCDRPAHRCDVDHEVAHSRGGATEVANLAPGADATTSPSTKAAGGATRPGNRGLDLDEPTGHRYRSRPEFGRIGRDRVVPLGRAMASRSADNVGWNQSRERPARGLKCPR